MARRHRIEFGFRADLLDGPLSVWLNHMRWIAALVVAWSHLRTLLFPDAAEQVMGPFQKVFYFFTLFADEAVVIFFVLSGLLVGGSILRGARLENFSLEHYCINRFSRLSIVLIPAVIISVVFQYAFGAVACANGPDGWPTVVGNMLYLQNFSVRPLCNNHPLWSLSSEAYYYLVGPPLIFAVIRRSTRDIALAVLAVVPAIIWLRYDYLTALLGLILWLMGLLPWLVRIRLSWQLAIVPFVGLLLLGRGHVFPHRFLEELALAPAFVLLLCSDFSDLRARAEGMARWLSDFSYSLYLTHMPLGQAVAYYYGEKALSPSLSGSYAIFAATLAAMILVGWIFGAAFESQTRWLRDHIIRLLARRKPMEAR